MILVNQRPQVEARQQWILTDSAGSEEWDLVLCVGEPFDFSIPFRAILQEIAAQLSKSAACNLSLPAYQVREDFVEGRIDWGSDSFDIYYEHSLGHLSLSSRDKAAVARLWGDLSSIVAIAPGGTMAPSS